MDKAAAVGVAVTPQRDRAAIGLQRFVGGSDDVAAGLDQNARARQAAAQVGVQVDIVATDADGPGRCNGRIERGNA